MMQTTANLKPRAFWGAYGSSMAALETMLSDHFRMPVRGEQLLGRWLPIQSRDQTRIGRRLGTNRRLGGDTVLGVRAWDQMGRISERHFLYGI